MNLSFLPKHALRTALFGISMSSTALAFAHIPPSGSTEHTSSNSDGIKYNHYPRYTLNERDNTIQPGQPVKTISNSLLGGFEQIGNSVVSAQQLFLGNDHQVYILDKAESNPTTINDHPAWASVYDLNTNKATALEVVTNTFCAGGGVLGNGVWLSVGGNDAVIHGGFDNTSQTGDNEYHDSDGRYAVRTMQPGDGAEWTHDPTQDMSTPRWYPALETLGDGRILIMGGDNYGGFVNNESQNNPTYEFYPRDADAQLQNSTFLNNTVPANLFPITHLLPSGKLFVNANHKACLLDYTTGQETYVDDVPHAVRTYPASASSAMLPLTKANNYTATIMYCGGVDLQDDQWTAGLVLINTPGSTSCVKISPDISSSWEEEDPLPEGRVMGNGILLPDGTVLVVNGAQMGVAGYADATQQSWSAGDSLADQPALTPVIYDPKRPAGSRWSRQGLQSSTIARMYHSTATLLPDGSVFIAGSNPHADYSDNTTYPTQYTIERFYPLYYSQRRPEPQGIPTSLTYGGNYFTLTLSKDDLTMNGGAATDNVKNITVVVMKTGFSTHALNFGMRMVELDYSYQMNSDGSTTLYVSQLPPNPAIIQPGPAWVFVTVNGIPSVGVQVMLGTGAIGTQPILDLQTLPESKDQPDSGSSSHHNGGFSSREVRAHGLTLFTASVVSICYLAL